MSRPATQHKRAAYPVYKPSGIEWLGEIPEHWEVKRLKFVANTVMGQSPNSDDYTFEESDRPFLQGNAEFGVENPTAKYYCETATKTAPAGSLLVSVRAPVGALNIADRCYGIGRGLCAVIPDQGSLISRFAWHTLTVTRHELWCIATGSTYEAVSADEVADMTVPISPLTEQRAIAAFLDRETARIDTLIEKKRRQIELLQEKRSALISHAVTKGLEPNAKIKDSGIEWLGEIPAHWEAIPLKRTFVILNGSTPKSSEPAYWDGGIPWATPDDLGDLKGNTLETTRRMITQEGYESCCTSLAPAGSLVLSTRAPIGHLAVAGISLCTNQGCRCLVFRNTDDHRFYYYQLLAAKGELESWGQGSTFKELGRDKLCAVRLLRPPSHEQRAIAAFLDRETAQIDALIEKVEKSIELLREYRTALISAAVTGKIDVRREVHNAR